MRRADLLTLALSAFLVIGTLALTLLGFSVGIPGISDTSRSPPLKLPAQASVPDRPPPVRLPSPSSSPSIQPPSVEGVKRQAGDTVTVITDTAGNAVEDVGQTVGKIIDHLP